MFTRHCRLFVHPIHGVPRGPIQRVPFPPPIPPEVLRRELVPRAGDKMLKPLHPSEVPARTHFQEPLINFQEHEGAWRKIFNLLRKK